MEPYEAEASRLRELLARLPSVKPRNDVLENADDSTLRATALDVGASREDRIRSLSTLVERHRVDTALSALLGHLFGDADEVLVCAGIRSAPPFDSALTVRLREMMNDPRLAVWREAGEALVRRKDAQAIATLLSWLRDGTGPRFRFAIESLPWFLGPDERRDLLGSLQDRPSRSAEDARTLESALGDLR